MHTINYCTHTHTHTHAHNHITTLTYKCTHTHTYIYTQIPKYNFNRIHTYRRCKESEEYLYIYGTYTYTYTHSHTHTHTYTHTHIHLHTRGAATWRDGGDMSPTLKSRGTSYVLVPYHLYQNIYFDWLVPPTYKIVPAPLLHKHIHTQEMGCTESKSSDATGCQTPVDKNKVANRASQQNVQDECDNKGY